MKVRITYCNSWSYRPQASRVEEEIKSIYNDANIEFIAGSGGNFIVEVDGKIVFSKKDMQNPRFPNDGEILELIKAS